MRQKMLSYYSCNSPNCSLLLNEPQRFCRTGFISQTCSFRVFVGNQIIGTPPRILIMLAGNCLKLQLVSSILDINTHNPPNRSPQFPPYELDMTKFYVFRVIRQKKYIFTCCISVLKKRKSLKTYQLLTFRFSTSVSPKLRTGFLSHGVVRIFCFFQRQHFDDSLLASILVKIWQAQIAKKCTHYWFFSIFELYQNYQLDVFQRSPNQQIFNFTSFPQLFCFRWFSIASSNSLAEYAEMVQFNDFYWIPNLLSTKPPHAFIALRSRSTFLPKFFY